MRSTSSNENGRISRRVVNPERMAVAGEALLPGTILTDFFLIKRTERSAPVTFSLAAGLDMDRDG